MNEIDWSRCPDVESVPGRCSGAWVVKGTRLMVQAILDNAEDCSPEEIATEIFEGVTVEQVRRILAFAGVTADCGSSPAAPTIPPKSGAFEFHR